MAKPSSAEQVRGIRVSLRLSQQRFAELLGVTVMTVSRWENGSAAPKRLSELFLSFLGNVVKLHARETILDALRKAGSEPLPMVRVLAWLERHPTVLQILDGQSGPPSSSRNPTN